MDEAVLGGFARRLDEARSQITRIQRVLRPFRDHELEPLVAHMAYVAVFSTWEGYVKTVIGDYLQVLISDSPRQSDVIPALLAFAWRQELDTHRNLNDKRAADIRLCAKAGETANEPLSVRLEQISQISSLEYSKLSQLSEDVGIDSSALEPFRRKINAFFHIRSAIVHGTFVSSVDVDAVEQVIGLTEQLMGELEGALSSALIARRYLRADNAGKASLTRVP